VSLGGAQPDRGTYDSAVSSVRDRVDACPGALSLHSAADGQLARVRLPGGLVSGPQFAALAELAGRFGDGRVELTSRGNLQLRALSDPSAVADALATAGLLPSATHERVRNIVASPLAGLDGGPELTGLVRALDVALCARTELAALPGRFLFGLDDGRGDIAALAPDVLLQPDGGCVFVGELKVFRDRAVAAVLAYAGAFLAVRDRLGSGAWRLAELDDAARAEVTRRARARVPGALLTGTPALPPAPENPVGRVARAGALVVLAPLGHLDVRQAGWLADAAGTDGLRVTPWRSVVVPQPPDAAAAAASALGLGVDRDSPWFTVGACVGRPGCARALADVQADARRDARRWPGRSVRWSGCERRCGRPAGTEIDVVATTNGYTVSGE
jgi:precorrin-3B synthase